MFRKVQVIWVFGNTYLSIAGPVAPVTAAAAAPAVSAVSPGGVHIATAVYDYVSQEPGDLSVSFVPSSTLFDDVEDDKSGTNRGNNLEPQWCTSVTIQRMKGSKDEKNLL